VSSAGAAVRVESSGDVTVHVTSVSDWSIGSYVALPLVELGTDYYVMTYSPTNQARLWQVCVISLVDDTRVELSLEARGRGHVTAGAEPAVLRPVDAGVDVQVRLGSTASVVLDRYQTLQVCTLTISWAASLHAGEVMIVRRFVYVF